MLPRPGLLSTPIRRQEPDQLLGDREAEAGAAEAIDDGFVGLGEALEDAGFASGAMPIPVSETSKRRRTRFRRPPVLRRRRSPRSRLGELHGVADEIEEDRLEMAPSAEIRAASWS